MKKAHILALFMIAAAIVTISLAVGNTSQYVNFAQASENPDKEYHVVGVWAKDKGLEYNPQKDPNFFAFYLKDEKNEVRRVILRNNKPQDFERSEKVVVIGKMQGEDFQAASILMKCPSKYNNEMPGEMKEVKSISTSAL
jgi:cytochrome c-type biogenesis protein CcmE